MKKVVEGPEASQVGEEEKKKGATERGQRAFYMRAETALTLLTRPPRLKQRCASHFSPVKCRDCADHRGNTWGRGSLSQSPCVDAMILAPEWLQGCNEVGQVFHNGLHETKLGCSRGWDLTVTVGFQLLQSTPGHAIRTMTSREAFRLQVRWLAASTVGSLQSGDAVVGGARRRSSHA